MVSIPRWLASSKARTRLAELPLVDNPTAMSAGRPNAPSCRANTTSTPMSLHSAVTTDVSLASPKAGSGRKPGPGCRNSVASWAASVALPPLPKASSRPPEANLAAMSRAHRASRAPSRSAITRRSATISPAFATVDARTCSSTADRSPPSAYRNGYSASIAPERASPGVAGTGLAPKHRYRLTRVHQDHVPRRRADQRHADVLAALAGVHQRQAVGQQPHHPHLNRHVPARQARLRRVGHVTTPGPSTPGCSRNTCTSSQRTWYVVTWISLMTRGSADATVSTWSAAGAAAIRPPPHAARAT